MNQAVLWPNNCQQSAGTSNDEFQPFDMHPLEILQEKDFSIAGTSQMKCNKADLNSMKGCVIFFFVKLEL